MPRYQDNEVQLRGEVECFLRSGGFDDHIAERAAGDFFDLLDCFLAGRQSNRMLSANRACHLARGGATGQRDDVPSCRAAGDPS